MATELCSVDWQALATFATGVLAVVAAWRVGSRQLDILRRQTSIQEAALRSDLFDRRYKIFERTEQFLREIIQHANDPRPETQHEFIVSIGEARFLFNPAVREGLDEVYKNWAAFHALKATMAHLFNTTNDYGEENIKREIELMEWFTDRFRSLPELFDELRLSRILAPSFPSP